MTTVSKPTEGTRPLTAADLDRVIAIDKAHVGHSRRHFFERRFAAAKARPKDYLLVGTGTGGQLLGFAIAHILRGEFGQKDAIAVLDALGVEAQSREHGLGQSLLKALAEQSRKQGVRSIQSEANWKNHGLMKFFDDARFDLAARLALERPVEDLREELDEEV